MHRRAPVEFQDAVETHFRKSGRHATIVWIPAPIKQWQVRISMRPGDPALAAYQAGDTDEEPVETVEIVCRVEGMGGYQGYELDELGVSGLIDMLEKADSWSGRGTFDSIGQAMHYQVQNQKEFKERLAKSLKDEAMAAAWLRNSASAAERASMSTSRNSTPRLIRPGIMLTALV